MGEPAFTKRELGKYIKANKINQQKVLQTILTDKIKCRKLLNKTWRLLEKKTCAL